MNLTERLDELAESDAPPMEIDVARAAERGRFQRLRRRTALAATIAAVALATGLAAVPMLSSSELEPAATQPAAPLVTYATFGWLPEGITRVDFGNGGHGNYTHATNENEGLGTHMWITVHPAGDVPRLPHFGDREEFTIPAQPVNGRTAYWVTEIASDPLNGGNQAYLLWQAADGQWVVLNAYYLQFFSDPLAVVHRVATDVKVAERAEPLPVAITEMPTGYRIDEATFYRPMRKDEGTGAWSLTLNYSKTGPVFAIVVHPEGSWPRTDQNKDYTCKAAKGVEVCVSGGWPTNDEAVKELGGPQGVLDHFTPLGMNESDWRAR